MSIYRLVAPALALLILAACGGASPVGSPASSTAAQATSQPTQAQQPDEAEPTPGTSLTACQLVASADIEAALELDPGTVAEGTHTEAPTSLDPARNQCRYDDEWGGLVVDVNPTDGVNVFDAVESAFGDDAEALEVGEGGLWFEKNDRGYFLKGSVMVLLQFTHVTSGDLDSFRDPTVELGEAAVAKI